MFNTDPTTPPPPNPVPLGGFEWLIGAGAAFGAKRIWDKRKKQETPTEEEPE